MSNLCPKCGATWNGSQYACGSKDSLFTGFVQSAGCLFGEKARSLPEPWKEFTEKAMKETQAAEVKMLDETLRTQAAARQAVIDGEEV